MASRALRASDGDDATICQRENLWAPQRTCDHVLGRTKVSVGVPVDGRWFPDPFLVVWRFASSKFHGGLARAEQAVRSVRRVEVERCFISFGLRGKELMFQRAPGFGVTRPIQRSADILSAEAGVGDAVAHAVVPGDCPEPRVDPAGIREGGGPVR